MSSLGFDVTPRPSGALERLPPLSRDVLLRGAAEPPHGGVTADGVPWSELFASDETVVLSCAASGLPVFSTADAFWSPSGLPSFHGPVADVHVAYRPDGAAREISCAATLTHLGHAIEEGTGVRYRLNKAAMSVAGAAGPVAALFRMACYWHTQRLFDRVPGVLSVVAGVARGAEAVELAYAPTS